MLEDAVASIRLHVNHHDPYEEWEKDTRQEAFVRPVSRIVIGV